MGMMALEGLAIQDQADLHTMDLEGQLIVAQAARVMQAPVAQHMTGLAGLHTVVLVVQCLGYPAALPMMAQVVRHIVVLVAPVTLALVGPVIRGQAVTACAARQFADKWARLIWP